MAYASPSSHKYDMSNTYRGHAVIIVNKTFRNHSQRLGAEHDAKKMEALFKALDFFVTVLKDLTAEEMKDVIRRASQSLLNLDSDCFVLVLSSHGNEEEVSQRMALYTPQDALVWRQGVLGVDDATVYVDEILSIFESSDENVLTGKPKLFFIQACRSGHLAARGRQEIASFDTGGNIQVQLTGNLSGIQPSDAGTHEDDFVENVESQSTDQSDTAWKTEIEEWGVRGNTWIDTSIAAAGQGPGQRSGHVITDIDVIPLPPRLEHAQRTTFDIVLLTCPEDCLVMYPVLAGKNGFHGSDIGSHMLHYMYQEANRKALLQGHDILRYLMYVNNSMAALEITFEPSVEDFPNACDRESLRQNMPFKVTTSVEHRLTKCLKFEPKSPHSIMANMKNMRV